MDPVIKMALAYAATMALRPLDLCLILLDQHWRRIWSPIFIVVHDMFHDLLYLGFGEILGKHVRWIVLILDLNQYNGFIMHVTLQP